MEYLLQVVIDPMDPASWFLWIDSQAWFHAITTLISGAAVIAAVTPTKYDNLGLKIVRILVDFVAFNVANAENKK